MGKQEVCRHGSIHYRCNVFRDVQPGARIAGYGRYVQVMGDSKDRSSNVRDYITRYFSTLSVRVLTNKMDRLAPSLHIYP